jgi:hypothetical protein
MIHNKRIAFPALAEPKAIGEGSPAFGARFIIEPNDPEVALMDATMEAVAAEKWKEDGDDVLEHLIEEGLTAFKHSPYRSKKTGKVYDGFQGKFNLGTRSEKTKPTVLNEFGKEVSDTRAIESLIYSGCFVHAQVEFWAQDNTYGRRINASLLGVMFADRGESFGGGSPPADASDFKALARRVDIEDVL